MFYLGKQSMRNTHYSKLNLFIRSLIFSISSITSIMIYSCVVAFSMLFPLRYRHILIRYFLSFYMGMLKHICHIEYQIEGLENIPKNINGVVLSKHQSTLETLLLPLIFHDPAVIVKRELLWLPFFGWGLAASDPISINRSNKSTAMQQVIQKGKECLDQGRWLLIFPEGTRTAYGKVGHYKLGGARLAVATGYPVIPVAHNAGRFWPRRKFIKQPGTVRVVIGPMIETKGLTPEEVMELSKRWIEGTMTRADM
jgi:1-acyl-sn-glycerol-3-phosphate acyltransferase